MDRYDWLTSYLRARGLTGYARATMVVVVAVPAAVTALLLHSIDGPRGIAANLSWVPTAIGAGSAVLWILRWPTRTQFIVFAVACCTAIASICVLVPVPQDALLCTYAFMIAGALLALFQMPKLMLYNLVMVAGVSLYQSLRLANTGHLALATIGLFLVLLTNTAIPLTVYFLVDALGSDLLQADRDPLTGLLNRRAFRTEALRLTAQADPNSWLTIALVDLDSFKTINDKYGHDAGDRALVQVAQALLTLAGDQTIVSRSGGEEFLVLTTTPNNQPQALAQRICSAVADSPAPVTASVGTASARLDVFTHNDHRGYIEELVIAADTAMYRAKRNGGNQIYHYEPRGSLEQAREEPTM